jgi:Heparinase II/III-like protein/Heparinase II/III N-terminus
MLQRAGRLLARIRGTQFPVAPVLPPPGTWTEGLADAGLTPDAWIARRQREGRLYVDVAEAHLAWLRQHRPEQVRLTIDAAERVLRHEFDLLGSGPYQPADPDRGAGEDGYRPIDWYLDPVSGRRFPRGVPIADWNLERMRPGLADIKLPWELARCQHWPLLGQAWRLTGDDRFAIEIARELRDFREANPIGTAVNWACTMDVALRAANWALALELVRPCPSLTEEFWTEAYEALFDHGVFIERHLENTYEVTSNHFLSNVVGLFFAAAAFRDLPRGAQWDRQCRVWLAQEMDVQVLPDGADFESSIPYHRLVTELFLGSARLAEYDGAPLSGTMLGRLEAMVEFLAATVRPDGLMPQVGDADDGRLHIFSEYGTWNPQDARHLVGPANALFRSTKWGELADDWTAWETVWWGFEPPDAGVRPAPLMDGVRHFPHAGVTVMRAGRDYLLVTNGVVGTNGFGNHKHNDLLGFEYHAQGEAIVVDPGSYVYTSDPDMRNLMRSTRSHNTVTIDNQEQNEIRAEWLFRMFEKAAPEHLDVEDHDGVMRYRGRHRGYARLPEPVVHERAISLDRTTGVVTILDRLEGRGRHRARWHFHFAPGVQLTASRPGVVDIQCGTLKRQLIVSPDLRAAIAPAWYSPGYGVRLPCLALDLDLVVALEPYKEHECSFQIRRPTPRG